MVVRSAEARVGQHRGLQQQRQAGEHARAREPGRPRGPGEGDHSEREAGRADQHAPEDAAPARSPRTAAAATRRRGAGHRAARPVLDVALGRIDPREAGIEPVAAVVQLQNAAEPHVRVGVAESAVEHRHRPGDRQQRPGPSTRQPSGIRISQPSADAASRGVGAWDGSECSRLRCHDACRAPRADEVPGTMAGRHRPSSLSALNVWLTPRRAPSCARRTAAVQNEPWPGAVRSPI